ncbi:MAG: hypothetical protein IJ555_11530 [Ruminococcus sp.]|nr:hypothetical protein [Ruminococcus sp.]
MDELKFKAAYEAVIANERIRKGIGTLGEKSLHAVLKNYYEPNKENHEVKVGKYVADIVGENGIIEIQTRHFSRLVDKIEGFLDFSDVTVVYPIAKIKYIKWIDTETGEITERRRSPKKGSIYNVIPELYRIKYTLDNPRMHIKLCMLETEETRLLDGKTETRKKGATKADIIPTSLDSEISLNCPSDYKLFIPAGMASEYTSKDFAKAAHISLDVAQTTLNLLTYLKITRKVGKKGRNNLYYNVF